MKKFFSGLLKGFIFSIIGIVAFMWLFSVLFPRAYNVLEGKILGIEADSVVTVVQNQDTLAIAKPKELKQVKEFDFAVKIEHKDGCYLIPTEVNGIPMKMVLDTGASNLTLSIIEYQFLRKQNLINDSTVKETECTIANGQTIKCYSTNIAKLTIGEITIDNVECSVMPQQDAPLLLGMNVLKRLGNFSIDYQRNLLMVKNLTNI